MSWALSQTTEKALSSVENRLKSENKPVFLKPWRVTARFMWVTTIFLKVISQNQEEHRAGKPNWWDLDLTIQVVIWLSCWFWFCSLIIRNKLTWKHNRLVSLSPCLPKLPHPHQQPCLLQLPPPSQFPHRCRQPLCPLVSGHLAWQSIILTAPRERKRGTKREKDWGYFDFQT